MSGPFDSLLELKEEKIPHVATVVLVETSGRYRLGPPVRPYIQYDNGHLDKFPRREPTASDRAQLALWKAKLEAGESLCTAPSTREYFEDCRGEDLSDALAAYRHFLYGNAADRVIDYERYLKADPSAANLVEKVVNDFRTHVEIIGKDRIKFSITSEPYAIGQNGFAPYPETVNWHRTLGGHNLWVSANVVVSADDKGTIWYEADLTIHVDDRYNFNPGQKDISSGIPDSENGRFEVTGLGKQYMNFATLTRHTKWAQGERGLTQSLPPTTHPNKGRVINKR